MKDRFAGWIESQQDPYQDPYEDDENESEEDEEYEEEDGEEYEEEDGDDEEYLDDESDEEYEDDEEEESEEEDEEEEDEAEEEIPAQKPASRPFGNGLNIQLAARPQNNSAPQQGKGSPNPSGGGSFTPKQVRPAPQPAPAAPPKNFKPAQPTAPQAAPAAAPSPKGQGGTVSRGNLSENRAASRNRQESLSGQQPEEFRAAEEEDTPKKGFWSRLTGFRRNRDEEAEEEDYAETGPDAEDFEEEESPRSKRLGIFSFFLNRRGKDAEEEDPESEEEAETEEEIESEDRPRIREKFSKKFSAFSSRVRSRLRKDEEPLDEFEEEIQDSEEDDDSEPGRPSRLRKAATIGVAAALLLAVGYIGYGHLAKRNKGDAGQAPAGTFTADLTSGEGISSEPASGIADSIGSSFRSATDQLQSAASQVKEGVSDTFENLASRGSEAIGKLDAFGDSVAEKVSDSLDGIREAVTPESGSALSDDLLANDDLLDETPAAKQSDLAASGEDTLDFDFGSDSSASPADDTLSDQLSVSETRPAYGKDQGDPASDDSLTFGQLKDQLSDAGEKVKEGFVSGVEKVGDSLDQAGQKTSDFFSGAGQKLDQAYQNTKEAVSNAAGDFKQDMAQARVQGEDAMQRVGEGVSSSLQAVEDRTHNAVEWTKDQFTADSSATVQNVQAAPLAAAPAATADASLQSGTLQSEPVQLSLGQNAKSEPLFLNPASQNSSATSSLGGNAADTFTPAAAATSGRDAPLSLSSSPSAGLSAASQATQGSTLSSVSAPSETRNAAAQEAAAVMNQTPDETFAAEPDLSVIGFGGADAGYTSALSPLSAQYAPPEETVPAADSAQAYAGPAAGGAANPGAGGGQLSSLDYNPADPSASAGYNNNSQIGYSRLSGGGYTGTVPGNGYRQYVTKSGDNLIVIAENELGDASRWTEISKLNSNQNLRGRLREGIVIYLPEND